MVWLASIVSEGDHRLKCVQGWAAGRLMTLTLCLGGRHLRELDFSDDRLCLVLDHLGQNDEAWGASEREQTATLRRVDDVKPRRVRLDSTTATSSVAVTEDGLFQFGRSKERRDTLPTVFPTASRSRARTAPSGKNSAWSCNR